MRDLSLRMLAVLIGAAVLSGLLAAPARAATPAQFIDGEIFKPHHSPITAAMLANNARWYGIDILPQLVILAAETSFGDPKLGGQLARSNNFGCLRYSSTPTKWGALANGKIAVAGGTWYTFPSAQAGMAALGRFLKVARGGGMKAALDETPYDWASFASAYYGPYSGLNAYIAKLAGLEAGLRARAAAAGISF